jgi:hypothetical protein
MQAARAMLVGSLDVAMELVDRASGLNQRTQLYTRLWQDLVMRAFIWIDQGCLPQRLAEMDVENARRDGGGGSALLTSIALLQAGRARDAAAVVVVEDALVPLPLQWDSLSNTCWQAFVAAELAADPAVRLDPAVPAAIADRLLPFADHLAIQGGIGALGPVGVYLGPVEAAAGRTADAEAHLRAGIAMAERHGMRPALARGRLALAELLCVQGAGSEAAAEALAALAVAEDVGMELAARRARRLAHE